MFIAQGVKLELFIFDTFPMAQRVALMEVARDSEFAPVKNAPGSASDSPDTARLAILSLHQRSVHCMHCWCLKGHGIELVMPLPGGIGQAIVPEHLPYWHNQSGETPCHSLL